MQQASYFRRWKHLDITDEITALEWIAVAQDNTNSVYIAMRDGFETANCDYFVRLVD
jgi:hypothetical protein